MNFYNILTNIYKNKYLILKQKPFIIFLKFIAYNVDKYLLKITY